MKKVIALFTVCAFVTAFLAADSSSAEPPKKLKRSESFLGIHFDFHASDDCTEIGKDVDREMVEFIIDKVKPDYLQTDCKGHRGLSSYPTKVGNQAPGFTKDTLKIWRDVTAERGVSLYLHYSGVWDTEAVKKHPGWARTTEEGKPDDRLTSVYGPYVDSLLIPQLTELANVYGADGVWVDGECWAVDRDYCKPAMDEFTKKTGLKDVPKKPGEPGWFEWTEINRDSFRKYLNHYVTAMHKINPNFEIASNWAYSSMMPEPVTIPVDFISGDFSAKNSINSARIEGRSMVYQGKPWDLMAWSFTWTDGLYSTKSVPQFLQEAAMVLSLGGGFQGYFPQKRDGSIRKWQMNLMAEAAKFCRDRQAICHRAVPVPQIGLIYSGEAFYKVNNKLFSAWSNELVPMQGVLNCLLNSQNVVDVVMEHHLKGRMKDYPLLVWPEWDYINPGFKKDLLEYVSNGGNLIVIGPKAAALFEKELGVKLTGKPEERVNGLENGGWLAGVKSLYQKPEPGATAKPFGKIYQNNEISGEFDPASTIASYGKGRIAGVYLNIGEKYYTASTPVARDFLETLVRELFPEPMATVTGSHDVDVTLNRKDGKLALNLVNTSGPHANEKVNVFDQIPVAGPLSVSIKTDKKPSKVTVEPGGKALDYNYINGKVVLTYTGLEIHDVIVVE